MEYTNRLKELLKEFCQKIDNYLLDEKHLILNDLQDLTQYFSSNSNKNIKGRLQIKVYSENRREDGTVIKLSETILFTSRSFTIKSSSQEDYYGEYYTNNEYRIGAEEMEEHLSSYINDAFDSIMRILIDNDGFIEVWNEKFSIK